MKKILVSIALMSMMLGLCSKSYAAGIAVVDLDKIRENYTAAQELTADLKVKETELQKFIAGAQKQIENAKTPLEKNNLQEKLTAQFNLKREAYAKDQLEKWAKIEENVVNAVKEVSTSKKYEIVISKIVVINGGCDITEDVMAKLNSSATPVPKKK